MDDDWKAVLAFIGPICVLVVVAVVANAWCGGCLDGGGCP